MAIQLTAAPSRLAAPALGRSAGDAAAAKTQADAAAHKVLLAKQLKAKLAAAHAAEAKAAAVQTPSATLGTILNARA